MKTRLSLIISPVLLIAAVAALSQTSPSFPGAVTDRNTLRVQEQVEELFTRGAYDRAYFIYRNELAPRGDKYAQYMIGYMHLTGTGMPENPGAALAWYRLAAERSEPAIVNARDELEKKLNATQIAAANALFDELRRELSDRVLILALVRDDLKKLREYRGLGPGQGAGHMLVIDPHYGNMSGAQYYKLIKNRLEARLAYLRTQVEVSDVGAESGGADLAELEAEISQLIADFDSRQ